ncbi:right-handed parallel beta-helix repeat-containing protein [Bacteroidota bacterium]
MKHFENSQPLIIALFTLLFCSCTVIQNDKEIALYVSSDGNDAWNGELVEKPFATIQRARDVIRELKKEAPLTKPVTVYIRGGLYELSEPLVFTPENSGTNTSPITYTAYKNEKPVISGGRKIDVEWAPYQGGIMKCSLPEVKEGKLNFTQLFINNERQILARYPNYDSNNPRVTGQGYINATGGSKVENVEFYYEPETFTKKKWSRADEAIVHIFPIGYWNNLMYRIKAIQWENHTVKLGEGGWQTNHLVTSNIITEDSRFFIENVFEELDAPGEWYLDKEEGILYYKPEKGMDLSKARVEVVLQKQLIEFRGSRQNPVEYIRINGLKFTRTATTFMDEYEVPSTGDWGIHRGGSVFFEGAEDCAIENCFFDNAGGNAVFISNHNRKIKISGNRFTQIGESAVCLVGKPNIDPSREWTCPYCGSKRSWDFGPESEDYPAECLISNNLINHIGVFGKQTAGVFIAISMKNTISHNHIHHVPRAAICINDPFWGGHMIEYNDIHETVQETNDHGSFNSWGRGHSFCRAKNGNRVSHEAGDVLRDAKFTTIIRNNRFRENPFQESPISSDNNLGIDMDDYTANYHVYNNLCIGVGVQNRSGAYHTIENNIFINPQDLMSFHVGCENNHHDVVRNIVVISDKLENFTDQWGNNFFQVLYPPDRGKWIEHCDSNLFYIEGGQFSAHVHPRGQKNAEQYSLERWRKAGNDRHSIVSDPMFMEVDNGDYRVKAVSPALELGFKNFPMSGFGLLADFPEKWLD